MAEHHDTLPSYENRTVSRNDNEWGEHIESLEDGKGQPWVWLKVKSRARSDKKVLPLFFERDVIEGSVEIDFDEANGAKGLRIAIIAGVTSVGQEELKFLNIVEELWDVKTTKGVKPKGKTSYSFALTLPGETSVAEKPKAPLVEYRLPPSFSERASNAYIDYRIVVTVRRSMFKVDQTLTRSFVYIPISRADAPSPLRRQAYQEGAALLGPKVDTLGWKVLPQVKIAGTIFDTRPAEVVCTFAIAQPLSYAIGSPIPLHVMLTSEDQQALDLLGTPGALKVQLFRQRMVGSSALKDDAVGRSDNTFREPCGSASFWPSGETSTTNGKRTFQGELEVKKGFKPSFSFPRFTLKYSISLLQLEAPGFVASATEPILATEKVIVHTANAPGVSPRSYAPPGYEHREEGNYNNAVGYLENGNQRFYHHGGFQ